MGNKEKGANAERELLKLFVEQGWMAIRVAGSGILPEPSCDLIAGKLNKKYAIECKTCKDKKRYFSVEQISNFMKFSGIFGLEPLIAIRFNREGWFFMSPENIEKTDSMLAVSLENAKKYGKRFFDLLK
jgi:Holliday junction resolvase